MTDKILDRKERRMVANKKYNRKRSKKKLDMDKMELRN